MMPPKSPELPPLNPSPDEEVPLTLEPGLGEEHVVAELPPVLPGEAEQVLAELNAEINEQGFGAAQAEAASEPLPPQPGRFGDVAIELKLLTEEEVGKLLRRQRQLEDMGLGQRIDQIAVEMGLLASVDRDFILRILHKRRAANPSSMQLPALPSVDALEGMRPSVSSGGMPSIASGADGTDPVPPCRLGQYDLVERIYGIGLRGTYYKAFDRRLKHHVALRLLPAFLNEEPEWVELFQADCKSAQRLTHPNLLAFHNSGELNGRFFTSIEMPSGDSMQGLLSEGGRFLEQDALRIIRDVAYGLYHAHVIGLVIKNVCPESIVVDGAGRGRIWDLGVGKINTDDPRMIESGLAFLHPSYLAPEQVRGNQSVGRRSDLYGLGATLFHMLTGHAPYVAKSEDDLRNLVLTAPVPDPGKWITDLSPLTRALVKKLMSKNPEDRIKRADGVISAIDRIFSAGEPRKDNFYSEAATPELQPSTGEFEQIMPEAEPPAPAPTPAQAPAKANARSAPAPASSPAKPAAAKSTTARQAPVKTAGKTSGKVPPIKSSGKSAKLKAQPKKQSNISQGKKGKAEESEGDEPLDL